MKFQMNMFYINKIFVKHKESPMFHHYGWVRTKEQMLKKVITWGHRNERNWKELVNLEFSRNFTENDRDFVNGYRFYKVDNLFNL